ncbi:MAG: hypothetical protein PVH62_04050 [Anaerolineae bacterium]
MYEEDAPPGEAWVRRVERAGLTPVVIPLLEVARALGFLAGQALLLGEPLVAGTTTQGTLRGMAEWLADPDQVDRLLRRFETGIAVREGRRE